MITFGFFLDSIYSVVDAYDDEKQKAIKRFVNMVYYQLIAEKSWELLRRTKTLDFSSADSDGIWLPANLAGIDYIGDSTRRYHASGYPSEGDERYRYYTSSIQSSPLALTRLSIKPGVKTFSPAVSSDYIGEYVRFGKELGLYEIDSTTTITSIFMGEIVSAQNSQIRPSGTKKISCIDDSGDQIETSVSLYYWVFPPPLCEESQTIMLPSTRAMELAVLARAIGELDHRVEDAKDLRYMFPKALDKLMAMNAPFIPPAVPEDRYGEESGWGCE